jgi:hypothetical protein
VRGNTLLWKAVKYTGDPDIFWFTGRRGPAYVAVDDERRVAGHDRIRWHHGQLLVEAEFLADLLGAQVKPTLNIQYFATLEREGTKVPMEGTLLRTLGDGAADEPPYRLFLNPRPALAAFDSTVRVGTDRRGDAKVRFACFQSGPKTAMASALAVGQKLAYRLRCLNTIAQRWPEHAAPLCRTICTRSKEKPEVILWAVGHCAGQQVPQAAPEAVIPRLTETSEGRVETVAEIALSTNDDSILRGAALVLARLDAAAARDYLISHISKGANWQHGSRRGRNSGLALRIMRCSDACERLVSAVESYNGRQPAEDALYALGFLGDDKAIDFLVKTALDPKYKGDVAGVATRALGHLRTAAALNACADLIDRSGDPKIISRARGVLVVATGYYRPPSRLVPPAPAWATALSDSDACRSALPHLERLAKAPKKHGDFTQFLAYVREKLAE